MIYLCWIFDILKNILDDNFFSWFVRILRKMFMMEKDMLFDVEKCFCKRFLYMDGDNGLIFVLLVK